jgi:tetratricopeptide (TPR) repeat protein
MNRKKMLAIWLASLLVSGAILSVNAGSNPSAEVTDAVPLYDDLGEHHYPISTHKPEAQRFFDQGLRLYYAFNHAEAIRSFRAAQRIDPDCAMCWWGEALAWGPNINLPMDRPSAAKAYAAVRQALLRRDGASGKEQGLIQALALRYASPPPDDRARLDRDYADALRVLTKKYPHDQDIAVLYGESLMDLRPWDYWTETGEPKPGIAEALASFEKVIEVNENHPGACHFFIHAVEKVYPERAVACADRLAKLMPGAGHIVHMPGHIYIRVGRYRDAIEANRHAVHTDEDFIRDQKPEDGMYTIGYYPHNYDFLAFAASMVGSGDEAINAAYKVVELVPLEASREPGMAFVQHWAVRPLQMLIRFGRWQEILASPQPSDDLMHAKAIWHYARGRAFAATGDYQAARKQLVQLRQIITDPSLSDLRMEFNRSSDILNIASQVLEGWIAAFEGRYDDAIASLTEAVQREDALLYGEPPEWSVPVRHELGAVLIKAKQYAKAERVIREGLEQFPANGWSLKQLAISLREQGKHEKAVIAETAFEKVWLGTAEDLVSTAIQ